MHCKHEELSKPSQPIAMDQQWTPDVHVQSPTKCFDPKICDSCDSVITDFYIMKVMSTKATGGKISERCWHERCLKCCMCGKNMQVKCFERDKRFYCAHDYYRLFGHRCVVCRELIKNMDMVMRPCADQYCHTACFRCVTCGIQLNTGDLFSYNHDYGWLYCQTHTIECNSSISSDCNSIAASDLLNTMCGKTILWGDDYIDDVGGKGDKRPRTVLSSSQRKILKSAFDIDPKPSKKARHIMAAETGLSNRVVQVWFQNQRAKMKKRIKCSGTDDNSDSDQTVKKGSRLHAGSTSSNDENFESNDVDETEMDHEQLHSLTEFGSEAAYKQLDIQAHSGRLLYNNNKDSNGISKFNTTLTSYF